jgi:uncharacterized membrane protein
MKNIGAFLLQRLVAGLLVIAPVYLSILLLLKGMGSLVKLVSPLAALLPDWLPREELVALVLVLLLCLFVGLLLVTPPGRSARAWVERTVFERLPGYGLIRSLAQQVAGQGQDSAWTPALVEIEDALVPGFIIEELPDGRYTVFVPSVPTPLAGAVYVLDRARVHPTDVSFAEAVKVVTRWGHGAGIGPGDGPHARREGRSGDEGRRRQDGATQGTLIMGASALLALIIAAGGSAAAAVESAPFSLTLQGAASLGTYEAAVNWTVIRLIRSNRLEEDAQRGHRPRLEALSGSSAGSVNALLAAALWCEADDEVENLSVDRNLLRDVWLRSVWTSSFRATRPSTLPRTACSRRPPSPPWWTSCRAASSPGRASLQAWMPRAGGLHHDPRRSPAPHHLRTSRQVTADGGATGVRGGSSRGCQAPA